MSSTADDATIARCRQILEIELFKSSGPSKATVVKAVNQLRQIDGRRTSSTATTAEVARLDKLAVGVTDPTLRQGYRDLAAQTKAARPSMGDVDELRARADRMAAGALAAATAVETQSLMKAARDLRSDADRLEAQVAPGAVEKTYRSIAAAVRSLNSRVDTLAAAHSIPVPAGPLAIDRTHTTVVDRFLAIADDHARATKILARIERSDARPAPIAAVPTTPKATVAADLVKLADYRTKATQVFDRDLQAGYRQLAADLETSLRQRGVVPPAS